MRLAVLANLPGLTSRILSARSVLSMRSGRKKAASRVRELRNFIYGWLSFTAYCYRSVKHRTKELRPGGFSCTRRDQGE